MTDSRNIHCRNMDNLEIDVPNPPRPTVIFFHGLTENSIEFNTSREFLTKNPRGVKRFSNVQNEELTSKVERKLDEDAKIFTRGEYNKEIFYDLLHSRVYTLHEPVVLMNHVYCTCILNRLLCS